MKRTNSFGLSGIKNFPATIIIAFILSLVSGLQGFAAEKVLFESNFSDLATKWEIWDDPQAKNKPSQWRMGLAELSGINNKARKVATTLIAGESSWRNYTIETTLFKVNDYGYISMFVFGYQDPLHFYHVGYKFDEGRFELEARTPKGFETLAFCKMDFPSGQEIPFRLDFAGGHIRFSVNNRVIFDLEDGRYQRGRFGLGTSYIGSVFFGPMTVTSLDPSTLPRRAMQDLLSLARGATVVSSTPKDKKNEFEALIDHRSSLSSTEVDNGRIPSIGVEGPPSEAVFSFPHKRETVIHRIGLHLSSWDFPDRVEFLVSRESPEKGFTSLGTFQIEAKKDNYQEFQIKPVMAKYLKIRILSGKDTKSVRIAEMYAYGYYKGMSPESSLTAKGIKPGARGKLLFKEDFTSGNLDQWQVWDDPKAEEGPSHWALVLSEYSGIKNAMLKPATALIAGNKEWKNYSVQADLFAYGGDGNLTGIIFGYQDPEHFYHVGYNHYLKRYELEARTSDGFQMLAFAEVEFPRTKWVPLCVDFAEGRMLFRAYNSTIFDVEDRRFVSGKVGVVTSELDLGKVLLRKFRVASIDPGALPPRQIQDLLAAKRGAAVIYRTVPPLCDPFNELLDHSLVKKGELGNTYELSLTKVKLPEEATFCFPQGRFVEIHRIGFKLSYEHFPKEIKLWVSHQTPKSGFKPLATIILKPKAESYQEFPVSPVRAKYLKIQITQTYDPKYLKIAEIFVKGYFKEPGTEPAGEETLGEVQLHEKESNNSVAEAQTLPLDTYLGGQAAQQDTDYYLLSLKDLPGETLTLFLNNIGILRPEYTLFAKEKKKVEPTKVLSVGRRTKLTYTLKPDDYYLKIVRPETYLTIVYDDSGSMGECVPIVKRVLKGYLENLGEGLNLKLMKYTDEPIDLSDFTHDPLQLKQAIEKEVRGGGGTETYVGLMAAIDRVREKSGNRAVLAIFDEIDGNRDLENYIKLWDDVLDAQISFSTIGVQSGWDSETEHFGNTRQQIFRELAYASQGQFYHSPSDGLVKQSANTLFKQLTEPAQYCLKAEWKKKVREPGFVQVLFEKGAEKETAKYVELILDASRSMWGQIKGKSKISIARQVLGQIVRGLPEKMNVGLRVYGHRYNPKDKRACRDTELMVPIGPLARKKLITTINKIKPKGKTPLVYSVEQAPKDFKNIGKGTVILISDGIESCHGDIHAIGPTLKKSDLDLRVHIVGFGIKEAEARKELEAIAQSTGGKYFDAKDSKGLLSSLKEALRIEYVLLDEGGEAKASGFVGGKPVKVMEGTYTLRLLLEPEPLETEVVIKPKEEVRLVLRKEKDKWTIKR